MVYNGDIEVIESGELIVDNWAGAKLKGVMLGRGLLVRPWILGDKGPQEVVHDMHAIIYRHAVETLCGDSQALTRLHAFWEYVDIPHKQKKAIMKATSLPRYREAVTAAMQVI